MTEDEIKRRAEALAKEFCKDWPTEVYHPNDLTTFYEKGYTQAAADCAKELAKARAASEELARALEFYSTFQNFTHCSLEGEPECADPEYPNWMSGEGEYDIEDGSVAREALAKYRKEIKWAITAN